MGVNLIDADALSLALGRDVADWTRVAAQSDARPRRPDLVCASAMAWHDAVRTLEREGFGAFAQRYADVDALAGRPVNVLDKGAVLMIGTARGVDAQGRLLLRTEAGDSPSRSAKSRFGRKHDHSHRLRQQPPEGRLARRQQSRHAARAGRRRVRRPGPGGAGPLAGWPARRRCAPWA